MARTVEIALDLARRRSVRAGAIALALLGLAAGSLPLLEAPGYELGEAGALLAAALAPFLGIAAARRERARPDASPLAAWAGASLVLCALLVAGFAAALVRAALGPCSVGGRALLFLPLLALPSALLGSALAVAVAFLARGGRAHAGVLYVAVALASLAVSLRAAYVGPAAFVHDGLLGAWPGPIYDEAVVPDLRVLLLRAGAAAEAVALACFVEAWVRAARAGLRAALAPALALLVAAGGAAGARGALRALALSGERDAVARALGGRIDGPRCVLHHPAEKPAAAAAALHAECEFHQADLARALGLADPPRVTAWVYRSAEEKRRLVGAAGTDFAKPWLGEVHLVDAPLPHPILRHELAHAVAGPIAGGLFGVPARGAVFVSAGLIEGLATALETPRSAWTLHEWSRAARDQGLLPDVRAIVGPAGFFAQAPARAYTAAGSFLAFVLERHGAAKVREAYRTGDLAAATGASLDELAAAWNLYLDGVSVPDGLVNVVRARLSRPGLFARRCAREIATLEVRAAAAAREGRAEEACALFREAAARSGSAADLKAAADALARAGDLERADAVYDEAARAAPRDAALRAAIAAARGDLAWRRDDLAAAVTAWSAALAASPDRADERLLRAKLAAASSRELSSAVRDWLLGTGDPALALARVAALDDPLAAYLVGRARAARGEAAAAVPPLARAVSGGLPRVLGAEATRLLGEARCASGELDEGERTLRAAEGAAGSDADRARIAEALRRCAFERERGGRHR